MNARVVFQVVGGRMRAMAMAAAHAALFVAVMLGALGAIIWIFTPQPPAGPRT